MDYAETVSLHLSDIKNLDIVCWKNISVLMYCFLNDLLIQLERMSFGVFVLALSLSLQEFRFMEEFRIELEKYIDFFLKRLRPKRIASGFVYNTAVVLSSFDRASKIIIGGLRNGYYKNVKQ